VGSRKSDEPQNNGNCFVASTGDTTAEGKLRVRAPEQAARVALKELQAAPAMKGDNVRVMVDMPGIEIAAGYTSTFAQVRMFIDFYSFPS